jgi:hypothetical protein
MYTAGGVNTNAVWDFASIDVDGNGKNGAAMSAADLTGCAVFLLSRCAPMR